MTLYEDRHTEPEKAKSMTTSNTRIEKMSSQIENTVDVGGSIRISAKTNSAMTTHVFDLSSAPKLLK